uniref:Peptidoglycan-recognition protein n=1 Tax=Bombyx mori TaxID=7091 RepID=A0A142I1V3_BOMMO|nr:peptidoglycan-recognition protein [Bombyx mori]
MPRRGVHTESGPSTTADVIMLNDRNVATVSGDVASIQTSQFNATEGPRDVETNASNAQKSEKDKDIPFSRYLRKVVKTSSRVIRALSIAAFVILLTVVAFMLYFTIMANFSSEDGDRTAPHEWDISRVLWQARWANNTQRTTAFDPIRLVIIQHTVTPDCFTFVACVAALRNLQSYFLINLHYDIPYNFMIGNDGRVYEGRGWGMVGAHTFMYNRCTLGLGFVGNYDRHTQVSKLQIERMKLLLEKGVREGFLDPNYHIVAASDIQNTDSPGSNLYNALKKLDHFEHTDRFRNVDCEVTYGMVS